MKRKNDKFPLEQLIKEAKITVLTATRLKIEEGIDLVKKLVFTDSDPDNDLKVAFNKKFGDIITGTKNWKDYLREVKNVIDLKSRSEKIWEVISEEKKMDSDQFEIKVNQNEFDTKEQGVYYQGLLRIHFYDLFSYQRVRGAIARTSFSGIVFEEVVPIDQEFLPREQHDFRDLVKSLKGRKGKDGEKIPAKITFLANAYLWSAWLLDVFTNLFKLKKEAEIKKEKNDNSGVLEIVKDKRDVEWLLYINLIEGEDDLHYSDLEEKINPSQRNWDDFMIDEPGKYKISHAIQDFYFCEIGVRKVNKKYCLMHFTKNKKETDNQLVNFCFNLEEKAKSKLKNCVIREKDPLLNKWVNMLKEGMLRFRDFRSRDWFLEMIR